MVLLTLVSGVGAAILPTVGAIGVLLLLLFVHYFRVSRFIALKRLNLQPWAIRTPKPKHQVLKSPKPRTPNRKAFPEIQSPRPYTLTTAVCCRKLSTMQSYVFPFRLILHYNPMLITMYHYISPSKPLTPKPYTYTCIRVYTPKP